MRLARGAAAIPVFLLATVLLLVAVVLCVTILLLPLGIPLAFLAIRLFAKGVRMVMPRRKEAARGVRRAWRRKTRKPVKRGKKVRKDARKRVRKARKAIHV